MFDIHSIYLENFRSYKGKHNFSFPKTSGLYFLTGINCVESKLGSNGAGKSTLLDAIYWCLYGHTLRGLKGGDVVTWGQKSCTVTLSLMCGHVTVPITRTQNPNSLELDGKPIDQAELEKFIGLNADSFVYSVILPQFGQSFFELTPANKLTLFSQIMGLDYWLECSQKAALETTALEQKISILKQKIGSAREWIISTKTGLVSLTEKETNFNKERTTALNTLEREMDEIDLYIIDMNLGRKSATKNLFNAEQNKLDKVEELKVMEAARDKHAERREALNVAFALAKTKLQATETAYGKFSRLGATCPTCLQTVDTKHLKIEKLKLHDAIDDQKAAMDKAQQQWAEANKFVSKITKNISDLAVTIVGIDREVNSARAILAKAEAEISSSKLQKATLKNRIRIEEGKANPYSALIAEKQKAINELRVKVTQDEAILEGVNAKHEAVSFWVTGFKRLRLSLIEETLRALEIEVNNSLTSLGLVDWQVEFDVERENKSGGITKGFVVFVRNSSHPDPVRFEAWSGGEGQRLQLAGDLGLANLIMLQAGLINTIEFHDEFSAHLSEEGIKDTLDTLHERAISMNRRIFVIDHNVIDYADFNDTFCVIKGKNGSEITHGTR